MGQRGTVLAFPGRTASMNTRTAAWPPFSCADATGEIATMNANVY